jgi:endonuclease YncB( thermonuclease family)
MARWVERRTGRYGSARASVRTARASVQSARWLVGVVLAACLLAFYASRHWNAPPRTAIVGKAWVIDGDTIEIAGTRIRLEGIDAPESDQACSDPQGKPWPCGRAATSELRAHIRSRELTCNARAFDRYRRVLAVCALPDGSDINAWMVRQGWAVAYGFAKVYHSEEAQAQEARRGIWAGSFTPPSQWRHRQSE